MLAKKQSSGPQFGQALFVGVCGVIGLIAWTRPVIAWRVLAAQTAEVLAPWCLVALVVAVSSAVAVQVRGRKGHRSWLGGWWRAWWHYRRRWARMMRLHGLVVLDGDRTLLPLVRAIGIGHTTDVLIVRMPPSQVPHDWEERAEALGHSFGADTVRIRPVKASVIGIDLRYGDTLAEPIPLRHNEQRKDAA